MQLHQTVSYQLAGQTVTMSTTTTQATMGASDCSMPVVQPVVMKSDYSSPFVQDMAWVSGSVDELSIFRIHLILNV